MKGKAVNEVKKLVGEDNVRTGARALTGYFREPVSSTELALVTPESPEQLSDVVYFCNENCFPVYSVRRDFMDDPSILSKEGILVDLRKMDEIKKIDKRNLSAYVYAGVTFEKLKEELSGEGMKVLYPVCCTSSSVLRSYIDREMLHGSTTNRHLQYSIFHAILPSGEKWVSGSQQATDEGHADFREDQGPQLSPFFGASEDIFGIPYYGIVYTYPKREERKVLAFSFDNLEDAADLLYRVSRSEWCLEAFAANSRFLSIVLSGSKREEASRLNKKLKPWTAAVAFEHHRELVELWSKYTIEIASDLGGKEVKGEVAERISLSLEAPWYLKDRDSFKGRCVTITGFQHFKNLKGVFDSVEEKASAAGLKPQDIGQLVVPSYFGGAVYCEADIHYNPGNDKERDSSTKVRLSAYEALIEDGFFVDRPTGEVADMVFSRSHPSYVKMIKLFKSIVDPNGIMNPDQLIKGV